MRSVPYAVHSLSTIPWMRLMWLLLEQMNWNRHSTGSWRSMRAPARARWVVMVAVAEIL